MSVFYLSVGDKEYEMEYTRDSARKFEAIGYSITEMGKKIFTSIDGLVFVGLLEHNPGMNSNLAKKIVDSALEEYELADLYTSLSEKFAEVFTGAGTTAKKKKELKLTAAPKSKVAKLTEVK